MIGRILSKQPKAEASEPFTNANNYLVRVLKTSEFKTRTLRPHEPSLLTRFALFMPVY